MLKKPISINYQHQVLLDRYTDTIMRTVADCTGNNESKFNDFMDVLNIVIQHHNDYRPGVENGNLYDFLSIIPTNISIAVQAFLAGMETKRNSITLRAYRYMLINAAFKLVDDLEEIELTDD